MCSFPSSFLLCKNQSFSRNTQDFILSLHTSTDVISRKRFSWMLCKLWWIWQHAGLIPNWWTSLNLPFDHIIVVVKKNPSQNIRQYRDKDGAERETNRQPQDEQDQTANSEQVGRCGLEKGQFILVNRWPFKLDIECCWGAEVYQCPCPAGSELIPRWYSWCCEQSWEPTPPPHTTYPSLLGSKAITI